MLFSHAVGGFIGWVVALLAIVGLVLGAIVLWVSARRRSALAPAEPAAVPVWWDQPGS